jgi:acetyl-CoA acetyltransferase
MPDAVIVAARRTAIGTARRGTLVDADPFDMASVTVREAVARCGLTPFAAPGGGIGVAAMCARGGMSSVTVLETLKTTEI